MSVVCVSGFFIYYFCFFMLGIFVLEKVVDISYQDGILIFKI